MDLFVSDSHTHVDLRKRMNAERFRALYGPQAPKGLSKGTSVLVAASIFFSVSRVHGHFGLLVKTRIIMLLMIIVLAILLLNMDRWKPRGLLQQRIPRLVCMLAVLAVVGAPFGIGFGRSAAFLVGSFSKTLLLGVSAWALGRSARGLRLLAKTLAAAGTATCILALLVGNYVDGRLAAAYTYDANDLALIAVVTLPLLLWWSIDRLSGSGRWLALGSVPVVLFALVETGSRGGFLGFAAVLLALTWVSSRRMPNRLKNACRLAVIGIFLGLPFLPAGYVDRIASIAQTEQDYNYESQTGRLAIWTRGIGYAVDRPIFGLGINNFQWAEGTISVLAERRLPGEGLKYSAPHSAFIQITAELGFLAGGLFLIILGSAVSQLLLRAPSQTKRGVAHSLLSLRRLVGVSVLGFCVCAIFLSFAYYDVLYVLLALTASVISAPGRSSGGYVPFLNAGSEAALRRAPSAAARGVRSVEHTEEF